MRNSHKIGRIIGLIALIAVIGSAMLMFAGCSDKISQETAKEAMNAAELAQKTADDAKTAAGNAQSSADEAKNAAAANKNAIDALPDDKAVADAIKAIIADNDAAATDKVVEGILAINDKITEYEAKKADYSDENYKKITDTFTAAKVRLIRAKTAADAEKITTDAIAAAAAVAKK